MGDQNAIDAAIYDLRMAAQLDRRGGFDDPDEFESWTSRSAFARGIIVGNDCASEAIDLAAGTTFGVWPDTAPADLVAALSVIMDFADCPPNTLHPIPQARIDELTVAAEIVVDKLQVTFDTLFGSS